MASAKLRLTCALPPSMAWASLVRRSIEAWGPLPLRKTEVDWPAKMLKSYNSLDDMLSEKLLIVFWFFQRREVFLSQERMTKWSRDRLDDYILLPVTPGYVSRIDCFFVSHFWRTKDHPDPDGTYLRLHQQELSWQPWLYIWTDWTCMPQHPRSPVEEVYFLRTLGTMSAIIRNCGFSWFYPPFEARLWILYEVAEHTLTAEGGLLRTSDIQIFLDHIGEMGREGVRATLAKYGYTCSYSRDAEFLTSWLELLFLLRRIPLDLDYARKILDELTWRPTGTKLFQTSEGILKLSADDGTLVLAGKHYTFTPFPIWVGLSVLCHW